MSVTKGSHVNKPRNVKKIIPYVVVAGQSNCSVLEDVSISSFGRLIYNYCADANGKITTLKNTPLNNVMDCLPVSVPGVGGRWTG